MSYLPLRGRDEGRRVDGDTLHSTSPWLARCFLSQHSSGDFAGTGFYAPFPTSGQKKVGVVLSAWFLSNLLWGWQGRELVSAG